MKIFLLISVLFLPVVCSYSQTSLGQTKKIREAEAIKIAENFIIENGYTDLPATNNQRKIVFESIERSFEIEEILKFRRNKLQKKAYGILKGRKNNVKGFTIVFLRVGDNQKETGRAVTMDLAGKNIQVEHVGIFLKAVEKKL